MAIKLGSLKGPWALVIYLAGLAALYVGERLVGGESGSRWIVSGLGLASVLIATLLFLLAWMGSKEQVRKVERLAGGLAILGLLGVGLYIIGSDMVLGRVPLARVSQGGPGLRQVLSVAWPIAITCGVLPLIFLQWSLATMGRGRGVEYIRATSSVAAGASVAVFLCTLFLVNAIATEEDIHTDLSYFRTTSPSESSLALVEGLDQDTKALLFFPKANDVLAEVEPYFKELAGSSSRFSYAQVDRAMEPKQAEEYKVSKEGTVVLVRGGSNRKIDLGDDLDKAKTKLRKLDSEFQTAFLKLSFKRETIYMITGHGERSHTRVEGDLRPRISTLKRGIEASNYTVKRLDAIGGLSQAVPDDAVALLWAGPTAALFPGEREVLISYLDQGGRMLLLLDPEGEKQPVEFLAHLGLTFDRARLAHSKLYLPYTRTPADQYNIVTNKFSTHAAANTVSRFSRDLPVALPTSGSLDRVKNPNVKNRINFLVRSLPNTWADADGDLVRAKGEGLKVFQLAAAVSRKIKAVEEKETKGEVVPHGESKPEKKAADDSPEMRVVVIADGDVFADEFYKYRGNRYLLADILRWLIDDQRVAGAASSEEDVPVVHSRSEDVWWFYGTVFAVPLLVLGLGVVTRWGRGPRRRSKP